MILAVTLTEIYRHQLFTFVTRRRKNMQKIEFNADVDSFKKRLIIPRASIDSVEEVELN